MCGVVGIAGKSPVNQMLFDALTMLQHRGQDAAGIVTCHQGRLFLRKDNGMVRDVFHTRHMRALLGNYGIGHVRYPTAGSSSSAEAQPFYVNSPYGITLAHNGNLTNAEEIHEDLFKTDLRHMNTDSDSEVLLNVFAHELQKIGTLNPTPADIFHTVSRVHERCKGAYGVVAMITGHGLVGFRDPNGIRPLIYGSRETEHGTEYIIASESVAITALGFKIERDIAPGEAIFIDSKGQLFSKQCAVDPEYRPCIFEYVYFARTDSVIDKQCVYQARINMGRELAKETKEIHPDIVISVPDSGTAAAVGYSLESGVPFMEGLTKNRYVGRTFIQPTQKQRLNAVRLKLNPVKSVVAGKSVVMVDDSIVRGTTSGKIVKLLKDAGAKEVHVCISSPPVTDPCYYGIDTSVRKELIASTHTEDEICQYIGADSLHYISLEGLKRSLSSMDPEGMCYACFNAGYPDNAEETIRQGSKYIFENK